MNSFPFPGFCGSEFICCSSATSFVFTECPRGLTEMGFPPLLAWVQLGRDRKELGERQGQHHSHAGCGTDCRLLQQPEKAERTAAYSRGCQM